MHRSLPAILFIGILLASPVVSAQTGGDVPGDNHTAREEAEGRSIWEKLQSKETACSDLSDEEFGSLGEFFMGRMMGNAHETMNNRMTRMMGEEGEKDMHIVMGKRMSGCEADAPFPRSFAQGGMMSMMTAMMGNGMMGGWSPQAVSGWQSGYVPDTMSSMMGYGFGFMPFGFLFMILWWVLLIVGIVALMRWLLSSTKGTQGDRKTALDILRERYARGEIDEKEFADRKHHLEG
ncbi:MAG: SHOCT domain-containing protein [Candidatus Peribacteraceae bacterium]